MSTFKGFNVTGIDPNQYPIFTDDQIRYDKIYLILKPIDGYADVEAQKVWEHTFRCIVGNWKQFPEFSDVIRL